MALRARPKMVACDLQLDERARLSNSRSIPVVCPPSPPSPRQSGGKEHAETEGATCDTLSPAPARKGPRVLGRAAAAAS